MTALSRAVTVRDNASQYSNGIKKPSNCNRSIHSKRMKKEGVDRLGKGLVFLIYSVEKAARWARCPGSLEGETQQLNSRAVKTEVPKKILDEEFDPGSG